MWDEASQKARAMMLQRMGKHGGTSQKNVQVLVTLGAVTQAVVSECGDDNSAWTMQFEWQPWLAPPLMVESTAHEFVFAGLGKVLPIKFNDEASVKAFLGCADLAVLSLTFDSASSNLTTLQCMLGYLDRFRIKGILLHPQRCLSHQIHITRGSIVTLAGVAGVLYSLSCLIQSGSATDALVEAIRKKVRANLVVKYGEPPDTSDMTAVVMEMLGLDGDHGLIYRQGQGPATTSRTTTFCKDVEEACKACVFDMSSGVWHYYVSDTVANRRRRIDLDSAVQHIVQPLAELLVMRRWERAALSRWTGVARTLKRVVLGSLFNNILPSCLSALSAHMDVTENKTEQKKNRYLEQLARGEETNDHWLKNASRAMKVTAFFNDEQQRWKLGALLIVSSEVEKLHWILLGSVRESRRKASLSDLVDPYTSIIASSLSRLARLLHTWGPRAQQWKLLGFLGIVNFNVDGIMRYVRNLVLQVSSSLFQRLEVRHASWPYRLQWLISPNTSKAERQLCATQFTEAKHCCLAPFGRHFKSSFDTCERVLSTKGSAAVAMLDRELAFTTAPVECEHRSMKDEMSSKSTGVSTPITRWRSLCRRLYKAHKVKGGGDCALPLRRQRQVHPMLGQEVGMPLLPPASQDDAPLAILAGPPLAANGDDGYRVDANGAPTMDDVKGGNPKVCFINYKLKVYKKLTGRDLTKAEVKDAMAKYKATFDGSDVVKARWKALSQAKLRAQRVRSQQDQQPGAVVLAGSVGHDCDCPVWPTAMQKQATDRDTPIASEILEEFRTKHDPKQLDTMVKDTGRFMITKTDVAKHPMSKDSLWGCGGEWHNVCVQHLVDQRVLRPFRTLQAALNAWVDKLGKEKARSGDVLVHLRSDPSEGGVLHTWALVCSPMYNPKVQCYIRCGPKAALHRLREDGFCDTVPDEFPWIVTIEQTPSRLCSPLAVPAPFTTIHHETSDELVLRLIRRRRCWSLSVVKYTMDVTSGDLLSMVVDGEEDAVKLEVTSRRVPAEDAFHDFLRMSAGSAVRSGLRRAAAPSPSASSSRDVAPVCDAAEPSDNLEAILEEYLAGDEFFADFGDAAAFADESLGFGDGHPAEDDVDDAAAFGCEEPVAPEGGEAGVAEPFPLLDDDVPEAIPELVDAVVDAAADLGGEDPGEVVAPGEPEVGAGADVAPAPAYSISKLGYVTALTPPLGPNRVVGLVNVKADGSSIFANCHIHPHCSVSAGIRRFDVSREYMAEWLLKAKPICRTAPRAERLELARQHQAEWVRPY